MFSHLSVCVPVSRISQKDLNGFRRNFVDRLCVTRMNWLDFGEDPDPDLAPGIFLVILHHWEISLKTIDNTISQNVMNGFGQNLVDRLDVWQGWIDSILVKIQIQICPISGIQNVDCSIWHRYVQYQVLFQFHNVRVCANKCYFQLYQ